MSDYYVDAVSGSDGNTGLNPTTQAFQTLTEATKALNAGDTLHVMAGTYSEFPGMRSDTGNIWRTGTAGNPITVKNYLTDEPVISGASSVSYIPFAAMKVLDYWVIDGLIFQKFLGIRLQSNCNHWTFRNCTFRNVHGNGIGVGVLGFVDAHNTTVEDCVFDNLRSRVFNPGTDVHGIHHSNTSTTSLIQRCDFSDIGGDGIHVDIAVTTMDLTVKNCNFWVNRPYQYRDDDGVAGADPDGMINVGENGIDIKAGTAVIEDCSFIGFRPADGTIQDASGAFRASGVQLHRVANGVYVRRCYFENNCFHLNAGTNDVGGGNAVTEVSNCIFRNCIDDWSTHNTASDNPANIRLFMQDGITIENNTFYTDTPTNVSILDLDTTCANLTFRNNSCDQGQIRLRNGVTVPTGTNNIDYNMWANLLAARPAFMDNINDVDTADTGILYNGGYYPSAGSAGTGQGVDAGYSTDYYGNTITAFDIGAVQHVEEGSLQRVIEITRPLMTLTDMHGNDLGLTRSTSEVEAMEKASGLPDGRYLLERPTAVIEVRRGSLLEVKN